MTTINLRNLIVNRTEHIKTYNEFNIMKEPVIKLESDIVEWVKIESLKKYKKGDKFKILELGTKRSNPLCPTNRKHLFNDINNIEYIMTDYDNGIDVDVVCDIHKVDDVFEKESFDLIITCSTFEHFKYPQLCGHNLMKILKIGGRIFIQTHQTYPLHGYKFDYFRFSREALSSIFSKKMNFKTISSYFEGDCVIIPYIDLNNWNHVAESYLNVVHVGEKINITPEDYVYDVETDCN
jgi:hypothetical protein